MPSPDDRAEAQVRKHVLTFAVQDYFHVGALDRAVTQKHWTRLESRLTESLDQVLERLEAASATATFFVLGWVADRQPRLVEAITRAGHEVASSGYSPYGPRHMTAEEFRNDLRRAREVLEDGGSQPVYGYRCPRNWFRPEDLWALDVLAEEGYRYDSSIAPVMRRFAGEPERFVLHTHRHSTEDRSILEFPLSTSSFLGLRLGIAGGNYARQLPHRALHPAVVRWDAEESAPLIFYFRLWELDVEQPRLATVKWLSRVRHYRNLPKARWVFEKYLAEFRFESIADRLGLPVGTPALPPSERRSVPDSVADEGGYSVETDASYEREVTLVVPLFEERQNLEYLRRTLDEFRQTMRLQDTRVHFVLVDDGSRDGTFDEASRLFGKVPDARILKHERNRGIAAAILTGIYGSETEIVASIDCDCSYDPHVLSEMIPRIDDADLITASPYHPDGTVHNVPHWRLFLSKTLSRLYSKITRDRLHTFTSCCRVYRKSIVESLDLRHDGFLGIAELLIRLKRAGYRVLEHPARLESRLFGESKMKTIRTIRSHLGLLLELAFGRRPAARKRERATEAADTTEQRAV